MKLFNLLFRLMYVTVTDNKCGVAVSQPIPERRKHPMYPAERKEGISLKYLIIKAQQGDSQARG